MSTPSTSFAAVLGGFIFAGLLGFAWIAGNAALEVKAHERPRYDFQPDRR